MNCCEIITDDTLRELRAHGTEQFPFQHYLDDAREYPDGVANWHWHREMEFVYVANGAFRCLLGSENPMLERGDGVFINSGVVHGFEASGIGTLPNVLFAPEFVSPERSLVYDRFIAPFLSSGLSHMVLRASVPWQREMLKQLARVYQLSLQTGSPTRELDIHAATCALWSMLYSHMDSMVTMEKAGSSMLTQARLRTMIAYIETHYRQRLTLSDIAQAASVSKSEALRCFQAAVHISPIAYLNRHRLHCARSLLLSTESTVTEIAAAVGFESVGYFDRVFKKTFQQSPRELRRNQEG